MNDAAGSRTPEEEALTEEIERTREQLGETVEALAAKADVKGRAQQRVAEVKGDLRDRARAAKDAAQSIGAPAAKRAAAAGQAVRDAAPVPVQRSAGQAVVIMRNNRGKVASASLAALVFLAWLALRRRR
jgi:hypothetical protein